MSSCAAEVWSLAQVSTFTMLGVYVVIPRSHLHSNLHVIRAYRLVSENVFALTKSCMPMKNETKYKLNWTLLFWSKILITLCWPVRRIITDVKPRNGDLFRLSTFDRPDMIVERRTCLIPSSQAVNDFTNYTRLRNVSFTTEILEISSWNNLNPLM